MGHLDVIRRASKLFDELIVLVSKNIMKSNESFTPQERVSMITRVTTDLPNVRVDLSGGLLVDYVRDVHAIAIVKGLRAVSDFEYEFQMALANKKLYDQAETIFLTACTENWRVGKCGERLCNYCAFGCRSQRFVRYRYVFHNGWCWDA